MSLETNNTNDGTVNPYKVNDGDVYWDILSGRKVVVKHVRKENNEIIIVGKVYEDITKKYQTHEFEAAQLTTIDPNG